MRCSLFLALSHHFGPKGHSQNHSEQHGALYTLSGPLFDCPGWLAVRNSFLLKGCTWQVNASTDPCTCLWERFIVVRPMVKEEWVALESFARKWKAGQRSCEDVFVGEFHERQRILHTFSCFSPPTLFHCSLPCVHYCPRCYGNRCVAWVCIIKCCCSFCMLVYISSLSSVMCCLYAKHGSRGPGCVDLVAGSFRQQLWHVNYVTLPCALSTRLSFRAATFVLCFGVRFR